MEYNTNYSTAWNEKTGQEVREIIQGALNKHESGIASAITGVVFEQDAQDPSTIYYKYQHTDGSVDEQDENKKFSIKPVSSYTSTVNITDVDGQGNLKTRYVQYGNSLTVNYEYEVTKYEASTETTSKIRIPSNIIVNGINIGTSVTSKTTNNSIATGSFSVPASLLKEGRNTLNIQFVGEYGGATVASDIIQVTVYAISLKLSTNFDYTQIFNVNTPVSIPVVVTDSKGNTIDYLSSVTKSAYYTMQSLSEPVSQSTVESPNSITIDFSENANYQPGTQRIFLQASCTIVSENLNVVSNIIMLDLIVLNGSESDSDIFYATKLDTNTITGDQIQVNAYRYNPHTVNLYAYTKSATTITNQLVQQSIPLNAEEIKDISFQYTFKTLGLTTVTVGSFIMGVNVLSAGDSFVEPYGALVNFTTDGKQVGMPDWTIANFFGFDGLGNGYQLDADGKIGLLFNNGASAVVDYKPCSTNEYTVSFKFRTQNSIDEEKLIECVSGNTGFELYPEKVVMMHSGVTISREFDSQSIHEVTLVSYGATYQNLMIIYIDGSMQAVIQKGNNQSTHQQNITIQSTKSQFYLYSFKAYARALSYTEVQSIYGLNLSSAEEITNYVNTNNVFNTDTTSIKNGGYGDNVKISTLPVGARYLVLESYKGDDEVVSQDPTPWKTINGYLSNPESQKGIYHYLNSVKLIEKTVDGSASPINFYADKAALAAQGTSSMAYPAKNFRIAFKKKVSDGQPYANEANEIGYTQHFYTGIDADFDISTTQLTSKSAKYAIENGMAAKIFCLKADFAESSGSHNTGFARMVDYVMRNSADISDSTDSNFSDNPNNVANVNAHWLPQQRFDSKVRSTINGFPIYLFVKEFGQSDSDAIFYGKYNFNDEKSSKNVFGFEDVDSYFADSTVKSEASNLKNLFGQAATVATSGFTTDDVLKYDDAHYTVEVNNETIINPTECWEFSANTTVITNSTVGEYTNIGAFQYPMTLNSSYPKYNTYPNKDPFTLTVDGKPVWLNYNDGTNSYGSTWEYRYPGLETKAGKAEVGHTNYVNGTQPLLLKSLYKWIYKHNINMLDQANVTSTMEDFARNLSKYFNLNYLLKYFVLTKLFGNVDQRIKNCMLSFYCDPIAVNNTDLDSPMGHMRAFYIFYDNDTILGVDNQGALTKNWNIDEETYPGYNAHGIWSNLEWCFNQYANNTSLSSNNSVYKLGKLIEQAYQSIRNISGLNMLKFFNDDQVDKYSDAIFNVDNEIKYFYPLSHLTPENEGASIAVPNRVENIHGNRKYHRQRWFTKRSNWLDARYNSKGVDENQISVKFATENNTILSGNVSVKSAIDKWRFFIKQGDVTLSKTTILNANTTANLTVPSGVVTISDYVNFAGLYACSYLNFNGLITQKEISGEMKYAPFGDIKFDGTMNYLKQLIVSDYANTNLKKSTANGLKLLVDSTRCPNLEELHICNITNSTDATAYLTGIDCSNMSKLKVIDARGTLIDVTLPNSATLTTLKLEKPTIVNVANKPLLSTFTIEDTSAINSLTIGTGNASSVYDILLNLAYSKRNVTGVIKTITLGTEANPYIISDSQLTTLVSLAEFLEASQVRGYIVNKNAKIEQQQTLAKFTGLIISTQDNSEFTISGPTLMYECESVTIRSNKLLASPNDWIISQSGNTDDSNYFTIFKNQGTLNIKANPEALLERDCSINITAIYNGTSSNTITLTAQYIPITGFSISAGKTILDTGITQEIEISLSPYNTTKKYLLENNTLNITWSSDKVAKDENTKKYYYTMGNEGEIITASIGSIQSSTSIEFIKDQVVINNWNETNTPNSPLYWIYKIFYKLKGAAIAEYQTVSISDLNNIELTESLKGEITSIFSETNKVPQNLSYLKYFNYRSSLFNVPSEWEFTNIIIPDNKSTNVTSVTWNYSGEDKGFETFTFPSTLIQAKVELSGNQLFNSLKLDFSNTKITKIYNAGSSNPENYTASISITHPTNVLGPTSNPLFIYPNTLQVFGNYQSTDGEQAPIGMFNRSDGGTNVTINSSMVYNPTYSLDLNLSNTLHNISVGLIYGYPITNDINLGCSASRILNTYYTFYNSSFLPASPQNSGDPYIFSSIINLGKYTFFQNKVSNFNITLNSAVQTIGNNALQGFTGSITSTLSQDSKQVFNQLTKIGEYAFAYIPNALNIAITNGSDTARTLTIGDNAFAITNNIQSTHHTITISGKIIPNLSSSTVFGTGKRNTLYVSNFVDEELRKLAIWEDLNNNVNIVVV